SCPAAPFRVPRSSISWRSRRGECARARKRTRAPSRRCAMRGSKTQTRRPLQHKVALVAGATRGAGRGIACMLGEAGATVYCSGRSTRGNPPREGPYAGRPETIEETAEMVTARGGVGLAARTDHLVIEDVRDLVARIQREQGRLDILVNDISEGVHHEWKPFW